MLIPSLRMGACIVIASLSRRVNANSQQVYRRVETTIKLIKKGEC